MSQSGPAVGARPIDAAISELKALLGARVNDSVAVREPP